MELFKNKIVLGLALVLLVSIFAIVGMNSNRVDRVVTAPDFTNVTATTNTQTASDHSNPQTYDFADAINHVGEYAKVTGTVLSVYTAKSGVAFFDFCKSYKSCPFTVAIFASDVSKFGDLQQYVGPITIVGDIKSYQGKAEVIVKNPNQFIQ